MYAKPSKSKKKIRRPKYKTDAGGVNPDPRVQARWAKEYRAEQANSKKWKRAVNPFD